MTLRRFFKIVEIRTKIVSLSTFFLGTLYAYYATGRFSPVLFVLMFIAVLCVDMGTTAFNSYFDFRRGVDTRTFNRESDKVLVHEGVGAESALAISFALFGIAGIVGLAVSRLTSFWIGGAGALGMLVGFLYTGGPHPISRTPFGEFFAGGFLGTALFLVSFVVQTGRLSLDAFLVSLPSFLSHRFDSDREQYLRYRRRPNRGKKNAFDSHRK